MYEFITIFDSNFKTRTILPWQHKTLQIHQIRCLSINSDFTLSLTPTHIDLQPDLPIQNPHQQCYTYKSISKKNHALGDVVKCCECYMMNMVLPVCITGSYKFMWIPYIRCSLSSISYTIQSIVYSFVIFSHFCVNYCHALLLRTFML